MKRPVADRRRAIERHLVDVGIFREHVCRNHVVRLIAFREEGVNERREPAFQVNDDGAIVRRVDGAHDVVTVARDDVVVRIDDRLPRPLDVVGRHRHAVAPESIAA